MAKIIKDGEIGAKFISFNVVDPMKKRTFYGTKTTATATAAGTRAAEPRDITSIIQPSYI